MARRPRDTLEVWLHGRHLATLDEPSLYRYRLTFTDEALDLHAGERVLSLSMPVSSKPVTDHATDPTRRPVAAFLEGLLPEGNLRTQVAGALGVASIDKMALLRQVGYECAGAVQFLPRGSVPSAGSLRILSDDAVVELVETLPTYALPEGAGLQASLAGIQDKILLAAVDDGWAWPEGGALSTHLIKPEPAEGVALRHLVQTEDWAMRVAVRAGLRAAGSRVEAFGERDAIVVERYDRTAEGRRIHQEDFCQALGLDPQAKYEAPVAAAPAGRSRPSRLKYVADLASPRAHDPAAFRRRLLEMVAFNVVIGNGDAHSKNYSLLLAEDGSVELAPLYDVAPVHYLAPRFRGTGHLINGRARLDHVSLDDLAQEAAGWGTSLSRTRADIDAIVDATWVALHEVTLPDGAEHVLSVLEAAWSAREWRPR